MILVAGSANLDFVVLRQKFSLGLQGCLVIRAHAAVVIGKVNTALGEDVVWVLPWRACNGHVGRGR